MSISDAIGQIDQIVQWEQQLGDPAALTQAAGTGGAAIMNATGGTAASAGSSSAAFAEALAAAQAQAGGGSPGILTATTGTATSLLTPGTSTGTAALAPGSTLTTALTPASTGTAALLSGGDSQLLAALSSALPGGATTATAALATSAADPRIQAMIQQANSLVGKPYVWGGGHGGWGPQGGYDCSGFVSAVLHAGGYLSTPQDTTTLPDAPGIESGPGQFVTIYDRDAPGEQGHVILDINGQFYESGGEQGSWGGGGGVQRIATPSASYLATFNQVLHPAGL